MTSHYLNRKALALGAALTFLVLSAPSPASAARRELVLKESRVPLPGPPSRIVTADLDGDGRRDLVVVVAYSSWAQLGISETVKMDDIEGLVETLTVVPAIFDRRELYVFLADQDKPGSFIPIAEPLTLPVSVAAIERGPRGLPIIALTDDGLSVLRLDGSGSAAKARLEPYFEARSVLRGSGDFVGKLDLVYDLDGDGAEELIFPSEEGPAIYKNGPEGLARTPQQTLEPETDDRRHPKGRYLRRYPLPQVRDVNGDHLPDLLFPGHNNPWQTFWITLNLGGGRFGELRKMKAKTTGGQDEEVVYFGDLDGDGRAEWVTSQSLEDDDAGLRKGLEEARRPPALYRFYRSKDALDLAEKPYFERQIAGHTFGGGGDSDIPLPGGLFDLDHDGRLDLVAVGLEFTMLQAVRIMAVKSLSIGLDFEIFCQNDQGRFEPVPDLDLSGHFRFDLETMKLGQLPFFTGDFDGDGRADYVQMGRGKRLGIYRGQPGCRFPKVPDLEIELEEEPADLALVRIEDLDGDGASDLWILRLEKTREAGVSPRTRLDLYLTGANAAGGAQ